MSIYCGENVHASSLESGYKRPRFILCFGLFQVQRVKSVHTPMPLLRTKYAIRQLLQPRHDFYTVCHNILSYFVGDAYEPVIAVV